MNRERLPEILGVHSCEFAIHECAIETPGDDGDRILEAHHSRARRWESRTMRETSRYSTVTDFARFLG